MGIIRNLGSKTKEFSDFTSSEHLVALMSGFFDSFKQNPGIVYIKEDVLKTSQSFIKGEFYEITVYN